MTDKHVTESTIAVFYRSLTPARFESVEHARDTIGAHLCVGEGMRFVVGDDCGVARDCLIYERKIAGARDEQLVALMKDLAEGNHKGWRSLYNYLRVATEWPRWEQRDIVNLTYTHYLKALELDQECADNWLYLAIENGWSTAELERQIKDSQPDTYYVGDKMKLRAQLWKQALPNRDEYRMVPENGAGGFSADGNMYEVQLQEVRPSESIISGEPPARE